RRGLRPRVAARGRPGPAGPARPARPGGAGPAGDRGQGRRGRPPARRLGAQPAPSGGTVAAPARRPQPLRDRRACHRAGLDHQPV
ncbi:MAG: hypothetical protein AVDCRST_MAG41-615, partial [uncultured Corynebacteriales bacterium]